VPPYFQTLLSHCVLAMSSHVMSYLHVLLKRAAILPDTVVALRLGDVVPRHVLPPCLAEADLLIPTVSVPFRKATRASLVALIPRHDRPPSLAVANLLIPAASVTLEGHTGVLLL
jgi:hypothetical protein